MREMIIEISLPKMRVCVWLTAYLRHAFKFLLREEDAADVLVQVLLELDAQFLENGF
jgi:hypothetical protein